MKRIIKIVDGMFTNDLAVEVAVDIATSWLRVDRSCLRPLPISLVSDLDTIFERDKKMKDSRDHLVSSTDFNLQTFRFMPFFDTSHNFNFKNFHVLLQTRFSEIYYT